MKIHTHKKTINYKKAPCEETSNGMKKINTIIHRILITLFLLSSFHISTVVAEETVWYFTKGPIPSVSSNFATQVECENNRALFLKNNQGLTANEPCKTTTVTGAPIPDPKGEYVPITPQIGETENKSIYKLLVPLPGLTCMDNTGTDKSCIGNNIMGYLNIIFKFAIGLCAALAVIMLIIYGVIYMGDESIFAKTESKKKMLGAIAGLIIALGSWIILNTINPDLTGKNGFNVAQVSIDVVRNRAVDPEFLKNMDSLDTTNVIPLNYNDDLFLGYLAHQQGAAGASAILWANNKGLSEVPAKNPFTKAPVNANMKNNFYSANAIKVIGTSELTPANFLKYWALKTAASRARTNPILPSIETALKKVSAETGVSFDTLVAICRIESAAGCTTEKSITTVNSGGYSGLFQLGSAVWEKYGNKSASILDPYENALAAAKYYNANITSVRQMLAKN